VMTPGTIIKLPDGREATVTFNGLIGVGIKWGRHYFDSSIFEGSIADLGSIGVRGPEPSDELQELAPEALLRDPWKGAPVECVGGDYEIVEVPE